MSVLDGPASRITRAPRRSTSPSQELSCRLVRARARVAEPSEASSRPSTTAVVDVLVSTWGLFHKDYYGPPRSRAAVRPPQVEKNGDLRTMPAPLLRVPGGSK